MPPFTSLLLTACLLLGIVGLLWRGRLARRRPPGFVEFHPRWKAPLRRAGIVEARHFLGLSAPIVSGHPGRNVARMQIRDGDDTITAYLKRESCASWPARLGGAAAGWGFASRSLREARTLEALGREGLGCPEWMAAGEDGRGGAFLLVRESPGAADLRAWLARTACPAPRLRLARSLGAALARLHAAGFTHPDLYAKHVLVGPDGESVQFLDWQRSRRRLAVDARRRARDLAALHATLADDLARPAERMVCLVAYAAALGITRAARRELLGLILRRTRRLQSRRHIREKRQPPLARGLQDWAVLRDGALCVTPGLADAWPGRSPDWLAPEPQPAAPGQALMRRWLATEAGPPALLVRRRRRTSLADLWRRWWNAPQASAEQRHAELLLRLERHAIPAPRVLAVGRRAGCGWVDSFVLTQPPAPAVRLAAWLPRQPRGRQTGRVLGEAGAVLRRLHDASCYLDGRGPAETLAVQGPDGGPHRVVVLDAGGIESRRRPEPRLARRDLAGLERALADAGCGGADWRRILKAYRTAPAAGAGRPGRRPGPGPVGLQGGSRMSAFPPALAAPSGADVLGPPRESFWTRLFCGARRLRQRSEWSRFAGADWADRVMDMVVADRFHAKQGRSTCRWVLHAGGPAAGRLSVYLKRHYRLPRLDGLLATLWPGGAWSAAFREWDHLEWARGAGLPAPRPVAAAEFLGPWGRMCSFLAVEELHDMLPLNEAVPLAAASLSPANFRRWKRGLIDEMARLTRVMHDRRRFHKDLYLCHFYIARADALAPDPEWRGRVSLIDLHRLGRHPWTWMWWRMKDLAQLLYSASDLTAIDVRDRLAFWRAYRGAGRRRRGDRLLMRLVLFKWRRYRRHNARKKARALRAGGDAS